MDVSDVRITVDSGNDREIEVSYQVTVAAWASGTWLRDTVILQGSALGGRRIHLSSEPWRIETKESGQKPVASRSTGPIQLPEDVPAVKGDITAKITVVPLTESIGSAQTQVPG